jgi:hypothetical protein
MLMRGQLHALSTLYLGIRISVTTGQKLDGPQSPAYCYEDKISTLPRSQTQLSCYFTSSAVTILTELPACRNLVGSTLQCGVNRVYRQS